LFSLPPVPPTYSDGVAQLLVAGAALSIIGGQIPREAQVYAAR
jgi:hypothetical protein